MEQFLYLQCILQEVAELHEFVTYKSVPECKDIKAKILKYFVAVTINKRAQLVLELLTIQY